MITFQQGQFGRRVVGGGGGDPTTDPHFANVLTLLHFDGTDGSTTIVDSGPSPQTWTPLDNTQLDTANSKFGPSSLLMDGNADALQDSAGVSNMDLSSGDVTIECWVWLQDTGRHSIITKYFGSTNGYYFNVNSTRKLSFGFGTGSYIGVTGATDVPINEWIHVAATLDGTTMRVFLGGVLDGTETLTGTRVNSPTSCFIGHDPLDTPARDFNGWLDDFRVTSGVARYTESFTPRTTPFPNSA